MCWLRRATARRRTASSRRGRRGGDAGPSAASGGGDHRLYQLEQLRCVGAVERWCGTGLYRETRCFDRRIATDDFAGTCANIAFSLARSGQMCTAPQDIFVPASGIETDDGQVVRGSGAPAYLTAVDACSPTRPCVQARMHIMPTERQSSVSRLRVASSRSQYAKVLRWPRDAVPRH